LDESGMHAPLSITSEMSDRLLGSSPPVKEIENFTSNRSAGDG